MRLNSSNDFVLSSDLYRIHPQNCKDRSKLRIRVTSLGLELGRDALKKALVVVVFFINVVIGI